MAIGYKYRSHKVLGFIDTEGAVITEPGVTYVSRYHGNYFNVSIHPVIFPHMIGRYFSACNTIDNHNRMCQSDLALEKYWLNHSGYFRLATTVALCMGITYGKLIFYNRVSEKNKVQDHFN